MSSVDNMESRWSSCMHPNGSLNLIADEPGWLIGQLQSPPLNRQIILCHLLNIKTTMLNSKQWLQRSWRKNTNLKSYCMISYSTFFGSSQKQPQLYWRQCNQLKNNKSIIKETIHIIHPTISRVFTMWSTFSQHENHSLSTHNRWELIHFLDGKLTIRPPGEVEL